MVTETYYRSEREASLAQKCSHISHLNKGGNVGRESLQKGGGGGGGGDSVDYTQRLISNGGTHREAVQFSLLKGGPKLVQRILCCHHSDEGSVRGEHPPHLPQHSGQVVHPVQAGAGEHKPHPCNTSHHHTTVISHCHTHVIIHSEEIHKLIYIRAK